MFWSVRPIYVAPSNGLQDANKKTNKKKTPGQTPSLNDQAKWIILNVH